MNFHGLDNVSNFTGYAYDEVLEIYYAQARFYDPEMKRFTGEDIIKDGMNWYVYCESNPVMFVDPWGLYFIKQRETDGIWRYYAVEQGAISGFTGAVSSGIGFAGEYLWEYWQQNHGIHGGNSLTGDTSLIDAAKALAYDGANKGIEELIGKKNAKVGKSFGAAGAVYGMVGRTYTNWEISRFDKPIFRLSELSGEKLERLTIDWLEIIMKRAYNFIAVYQDYFLSSPWPGASTYFELHLYIKNSKDPEKTIENYRNQYKTYLDKNFFKITFKGINYYKGKKNWQEGCSLVADYFAENVLKNYSETLDAFSAAFKDEMDRPLSENNTYVQQTW